MDIRTGELTPNRLEILGVPVDAVTMETALRRVRSLLAGNRTGLVLAANPEKVIAAKRDPVLLDTMNSAALVIPDGIGVVLAARLLGGERVGRVPGADLMPEICRLAEAEGHRVFFYGARPEMIQRAAALVQARYPRLQIVGAQHGYVPEEGMDNLVDTINRSGADILFVGLGSPRQELWMQRYANRLRVKVCQGVGGTFDAICGYPPRAPLWIRRLNMEWLYRLVTQPERAHRQAALPSFAAQVLRQRLTTGRLRR